MTKEKSYMCPLVGREMRYTECYDVQMVRYGYEDNLETLDFALDKDKSYQVCETCQFNQCSNRYFKLKIPSDIIILFIFLALPIPILLMPITTAIMQIASIGIGFNLSSIPLWMRSILSLTEFIPTGTYLITYLYSLIKTIRNKKISRVSYLPLLHIALLFVLYILAVLRHNNYLPFLS